MHIREEEQWGGQLGLESVRPGSRCLLPCDHCELQSLGSSVKLMGIQTVLSFEVSHKCVITGSPLSHPRPVALQWLTLLTLSTGASGGALGVL